MNYQKPKMIYLSGPMTGIPDLNFPLFKEVAEEWKRRGWAVFNPAETDGGDTSNPKSYYMRLDIQALTHPDITAIGLLPGWENSRGALTEAMIARELGLKVFVHYWFNRSHTLWSFGQREWDELNLPPHPSPDAIPEWEEAFQLVSGAREQAYGHPWTDFSRTAKMWSGLLSAKLRSDLTPEDVAQMMVCVKMSREQNSPKRDNVVDMIGYAITLARVKKRRKELECCGSSSPSSSS